MRLLNALLALPALAAALPALVLPDISARQVTPDNQIQIIFATAFGPGCPPNTFSTQISPDGKVITFGFDSYQTNVGGDTPSSEREKFCDLSLVVKYPLGCSTATYTSTYHGFAILEPGVSGTFTSAYTLSPGSTGSNPPPKTLGSGEFANGGVYTKQDITTTTTCINTQNQRNVIFQARTRIFLIASNQTVFGTVTGDDATIAVS